LYLVIVKYHDTPQEKLAEQQAKNVDYILKVIGKIVILQPEVLGKNVELPLKVLGKNVNTLEV
jgi:hypothetical protein